MPLLDEGDIVVDAGNAHFADTRRREAALREKGLHFVGSGVSGGEEGALNGPSIMPGGSPESYAALEPMLTKISAHVDGEPCCVHVGPDGAGHFVKMLHNGIEYADMQLIAEAYDLLRHVLDLTPAELADVFRDWNTGDLESFLIEITAEVLSQTDPTTGGAFVDIVLDQAEQKGTGRWTVQSALDLGIPVSGMAEAVFARSLSGDVVRREAAAGVLPGPSDAKVDVDREAFIEDVRHALYSSKIVAYAQGFDAIRAASEEYDWNIDLGAMAKIWRGGCIIRARFLDRDHGGLRPEPVAALAAGGRLLQGSSRQRAGRLATGCRDRGDGRRTGSGVLGGAVVLRRPAGRAATCRPDPGSARPLRGAHLQARRP